VVERKPNKLKGTLARFRKLVDDECAGSARSNSMAVESVALSRLLFPPNATRKHPKRKIAQLALSLLEFGILRPILIDGDRTIIAGQAVAMAAKRAGFKRVPVIRATDLTEAQIRAFMIADNKLNEGSEWDHKALKIEFDALTGLNFDLQLTGFSTAEIDSIYGVAQDSEYDDFVEQGPIAADCTPISEPGDVWILGGHRLICGDACDPITFDRLMLGSVAGMACSDFPYNLKINGVVSGLGAIRHREFAMASGEMPDPVFLEFLTTACRHLAHHSRDGSIHMIFMDWRHSAQILRAGEEVYFELKNICVWNKDRAGMGSLWRSQHEFVFVFKNGTAPHVNNVELGRHGRHRSNVWTYPGANSFSKSRAAKLESHPTVKPVALVADAILDCSNRDDIILDPFAGSGTIFIAAEKTGRRGYGIEIDPLYVDSTIRRWEKLTGEKARHEVSGLTFDEVAQQRNPEQ
jgi:DNA modification methylase